MGGAQSPSVSACTPIERPLRGSAIAIDARERMYNTMKRTFRPPLTLSHSLHDLVHWLQCLYDENQTAHRHRGRRPPSLKKGGRSEAHREPPRRLWHLARQRLGPGTSRGRPGARHPPLRGDSATPGRLPAALRRRLDHDGQARSTRPERALLPGFFGLGQPTWAGGAAGHICRGCSEDAGPWARSIGPWASIVQSHVHRTATSLPSPADWPEGHQIEPTTRPGGNGEHLRASPGPRPARSRLSPDDESGAAAPVVDERGHSTRPRLVRGGSSAAQCSRSGARGPDGREGAARRSRALQA